LTSGGRRPFVEVMRLLAGFFGTFVLVATTGLVGSPPRAGATSCPAYINGFPVRTGLPGFRDELVQRTTTSEPRQDLGATAAIFVPETVHETPSTGCGEEPLAPCEDPDRVIVQLPFSFLGTELAAATKLLVVPDDGSEPKLYDAFLDDEVAFELDVAPPLPAMFHWFDDDGDYYAALVVAACDRGPCRATR